MATGSGASMTPELQARIDEALNVARDQFKLDPGEVRFVTVPANVLYDAASTGLPGHWSHWSAGRSYWQQKGAHDAGMATIYEMVVPTDPALALLMDSNDDIVNVMVAAHVFGHTHLNRNNAYFADNNPKMLDTVRLWAQRIEGYEEEHGDLTVEAFIDRVLSIDLFADAKYKGKVFKTRERDLPPLFDIIGVPSVEKEPEDFQATGDIYGFLAQYAERLEDWQRDILSIYRQRALFYQAMSRSKVIHEGFAAIAHSKIMAQLTVDDAEWLEYSKLNAGVMSPRPGGPVNPYWLGHAILTDIDKRDGWDKVLEVVAVEDDVSLIRNYLTEELVHKLDLFSFRFYNEEKVWAVDDEPRDWEVIRDALALKFSNYGDPVIDITDFDHDGKRALVLTHHFDGRRLDITYADAALAAIADIWGQRVHLQTQMLKGRVEAIAWAPAEREEKSGNPGIGCPVDWEYVVEESA